MLVRATRGQRGLRADDREIRRAARPSYTVDTLSELRGEYGSTRSLVWCIGWDAFIEIESWKEWRRLVELAHLAVFRRPGPTVGLSPALADLVRTRAADDPGCLAAAPGGRVLVLEAPMLDVSATRIRDEIARLRDVDDSGDVDGLLPAAVWSYIRQHQLYGLYGGRPI
jgi:nicotinate-nucleotide adenylyltransferase